MGRKKKKKDVKKAPERKIIAEYKGWKSGDIAWTVPLGESRPAQCEIVEFFPDDRIAPAVVIRCIVDGKYRTVKFSMMSDKQSQAKELWQNEKLKTQNLKSKTDVKSKKK